ncbi:hypothetical protein F5Y00DRAFT_226960 [Daldinia vernicosa]|uniref:uncharacterized protein n=1 Tax=Daldinia vernicosa TaxID=114800 RepID=UPI0020085296|nr:uncharacterized protein F5Y00DRAFT_226960 [Daldinia vernicosa]KAI0852548.1 hypothetical protein F5Y00DRAFT_226960 [Daldinia vernicosa]
MIGFLTSGALLWFDYLPGSCCFIVWRSPTVLKERLWSGYRDKIKSMTMTYTIYNHVHSAHFKSPSQEPDD